jgi:cell division protein FtsZ
MFEPVEHEEIYNGAKIKVIGVGGAGGNAINTMIESQLEGVDFIAANTDLQALSANCAETKLQIGRALTKGLGAGAEPDIGRNAALEDTRQLADCLMGADMVFVTAGMGGGTGTGAAAVVAKVAKECGALTVGVVTKPFVFEGKRRARIAEEGVQHLRDEVDTLITIPNEKLLHIAGEASSVIDTFKMADDVLLQAVRGIASLITVHGLINLDFADVRTVMSEMGMALMGTGVSSGENRAVDAATKAISSPLLENVSIRGATGILINITGGNDVTLHEINEASKLIQEEAHEEANIIFGNVVDPTLKDEIRVTVIATGFDKAVRRTRTVSSASRREPRRETNDFWDEPLTESPVVSESIAQPSSMSIPTESGEQLGLQMVQEAPVGATVGRPYEAREDDYVQERTNRSASLGELMTEVGISDVREDQYDIPTFLRKQAD